MKKPGRPPKVTLNMTSKKLVDNEQLNVPAKPAANLSLLEVGLEMARELLKVYQQEKLAIAAKYRACDKFKEGTEYRAMISREIGHIEALEKLIQEFEGLLK